MIRSRRRNEAGAFNCGLAIADRRSRNTPPRAPGDRSRSAKTTVNAHREENRFLSITLRSGRREILYRGDLVSGAIIASIVERAKALAIKRALATGKDIGDAEARCAAKVRHSLEQAGNGIAPFDVLIAGHALHGPPPLTRPHQRGTLRT